MIFFFFFFGGGGGGGGGGDRAFSFYFISSEIYIISVPSLLENFIKLMIQNRTWLLAFADVLFRWLYFLLELLLVYFDEIFLVGSLTPFLCYTTKPMTEYLICVILFSYCYS